MNIKITNQQIIETFKKGNHALCNITENILIDNQQDLRIGDTWITTEVKIMPFNKVGDYSLWVEFNVTGKSKYDPSSHMFTRTLAYSTEKGE